MNQVEINELKKAMRQKICLVVAVYLLIHFAVSSYSFFSGNNIKVFLFIPLVIAIHLIFKLLNSIKELDSFEATEFELPDNGNSDIYVNKGSYIEDEIHFYDPLFNSEDFEKWAVMTFSNVWKSLLERNVDFLDRFESQELYLKHKKAIEENKEFDILKGQTKEMAYTTKYLCDFKRENGFEYITLLIKVIDRRIASDELVKFQFDKCPSSVYLVTFCREDEFSKKTKSSFKSVLCFNCGAPFEGNLGSKCSFCGEQVNAVKEFNWKICDIEF